MKRSSSRNLAKGFDQFIFESYEQFLPIFEDSFLNKLGAPTNLINKLHVKKEHISDKYQRTGLIYARGVPIPMHYSYFQLPYDLDIPDPVMLTGAYSYASPFEERENERSAYKDIAWYLISRPTGVPLRLLISDESKSAFFYIYFKSPSPKNIPGDQFAMIVSFKDYSGDWKTLDMGFGESVTFGAALKFIGSRHESKGGNRTDKVLEYIKSLTGGPSKKNKILVYDFGMPSSKEIKDYYDIASAGGTGKFLPRDVRDFRSKQSYFGSDSSIDLIDKFASRFDSVFSNSNKFKEKFINTMNNTLDVINATGNPQQIPSNVLKFASTLGVDPNKLFIFLFYSMRNFRSDLLKKAKKGTIADYEPTPGHQLEDDNQYLGNGLNAIKYKVEFEAKDADEIEGARRGSQYVESKPEYAVSRPIPGEYTSIKSIFRYTNNDLDAVLNSFMHYILFREIRNVNLEASIADLLGMDIDLYRALGGKLEGY
jgi:hypothetical protein